MILNGLSLGCCQDTEWPYKANSYGFINERVNTEDQGGFLGLHRGIERQTNSQSTPELSFKGKKPTPLG